MCHGLEGMLKEYTNMFWGYEQPVANTKPATPGEHD